MKRKLIAVLRFTGALGVVLAVAACDDAEDTSSTSSSSSTSTTSTSTTTGSSTSSSGSGSSSSSGGGSLTACLDTPDQLMTPPEGTLPCELIPPGVTLEP